MSTPPQESAGATPAAAPARAPRIALWDNARFILIALVVIGHTISTVRTDSPLTFGLYSYIYLFHMPAMIFLSGYFSKPEASPKAVKSTVQLIVVWLIWEAIWALIHLGVEGQGPGDHFLVSPAWTLWFLVSLATMRIVLPYLAKLRHPLLLAVVLSLVSGLVPAIGTEFSASRTLSFMPFFIAGWMAGSRGTFTRDWFVRPSVAVRAAGWGVLAAIAAVLAFVPNLYEVWRIDTWLTWRDDDAWLLRNAPIDEWHAPSEAVGTVTGLSITLLLLVIATIMTIALLIVVPRAHSRLTRWGTRTLFVYLLHAPIIWALRATGVIDEAYGLGVGGVVLLIAGSTGLAVLLSSGWVARIARPLIQPRIDWMFTRDRPVGRSRPSPQTLENQ